MAKKIATKQPTRNSEEGALAKKAGKPTNTAGGATSAANVVSDREIRKIRALLQSKTPGGVTRGLEMLQTQKAGEVAFKMAFTPSVVKTIVESLDLRKWQSVVKSLCDLPALRASFERSIVSHFTTLSKQKQRACVDAGITHLRPESVRLFKELVDIVAARSVRDDGLLFSHLTKLTDDAAEVLVDYQDELWLPIATLSDNAARWLGQCSNWSLSLPALTALSDEAAAHLARRQGWRLRIGGLRSISDTAAALIAKHKGNELELSGLQNICERPPQPALTALIASRVESFQPVFKEATHGSTGRSAEGRGMAATAAAVRGIRHDGVEVLRTGRHIGRRLPLLASAARARAA